MRSYQVARKLFSFLEFLFWVQVVIGAVIVIVSPVLLDQVFVLPLKPVGVAVGINVALVGLFGVALVQMGRATVDTAEYSQQSLQVARDQIGISRQMLALADGTSEKASYGAIPTSEVGTSIPPNMKEYIPEPLPRHVHKGYEITKAGHSFVVRKQPFMTLELAKAYIDQKLPPLKTTAMTPNDST